MGRGGGLSVRDGAPSRAAAHSEYVVSGLGGLFPLRAGRSCEPTTGLLRQEGQFQRPARSLCLETHAQRGCAGTGCRAPAPGRGSMWLQTL